VRMVEQIESFRANLKVPPFLEIELSHQGKIYLVNGQAAHRVTTKSTLLSRRRSAECAFCGPRGRTTSGGYLRRCRHGGIESSASGRNWVINIYRHVLN